MSEKHIKVLSVDDDPVDRDLITELLSENQSRSFIIEHSENIKDAIEHISMETCDVVLLDLFLPDSRGLDTFITLHAYAPKLPIIILTGLNDKGLANEAVRRGAQDYVLKGYHLNSDMLSRIIHYAIERKHAEEERSRIIAQLFQGQKMQALGQLAAGIAHEINNPIGFMISNLSVTREYLKDLRRFIALSLKAVEHSNLGRDPFLILKEIKRLGNEIDINFMLDDFTKAIDDCKSGGQRIGLIVKSLKEFSHIDEGQLKQIDINHCMENVIQICWNELKHKAKVSKSFSELPLVSCNPQLIEQVFMNLLVNAVQAIETQGEIFITTKQGDESIYISIKDNGQGIKKENLNKLFEPFFTTKPVGKGTGLGLHVVYQIIKAHNGTIDVKSEVAKGTEFIIRLPVTRAINVLKI